LLTFACIFFIIINLFSEQSIDRLRADANGIIGGPVVEQTQKINFGQPLLPVSVTLASTSDPNNSTEAIISSTNIEEGQSDEFFGYYLSNQESLLNQSLPLTSMRTERGGILIYKVQKGDTLSTVAADFGISLNSIVWANNLKGNYVSPGQEIVILPVSGVYHTIKAGETVDDIAKFYSADSQKIIEFNNLPNGIAKAGDSIIVPDGKLPSSQIKANKLAAMAASLPSFPNYYIIPTSGINWGTLHSYNAVDIANKCGTAVVASAEGLVSVADISKDYGNYVKIQHPNSTETLYAHLSKVYVKDGDYVSSGQLIGLIGNTGLVQGITGCHLHFEVHGAKNPFVR
jgi:murein DD-endopeptidase MepM/ murein hydrolase activator NlpD